MRSLNISLLLTTIFFLLAGCVTKKKKEDVGAVGKLYHNTTARYNGYYNADLLVKESYADLEKQHVDNYNRILPVYKYVEADNPKAVAEKCDKAVEKISVVVNLHRVSRWTDDCYLLMGQAQYLKQDYESAEETLEFMTGEFDPREVAEREAKMKAKKGRKKASTRKRDKPDKSEKASSKSDKNDEDGEVQLSKKEKERLAKQKKKEREKLRKQKNKEAEQRRKGKGGKSTAPRGSKPADEKPAEVEPQPEKKISEKKPKKEEIEKEEEEALPTPGTISLGDLETNVAEGDGESYFLKHRPAYQSGVLWLARTYIERESYTNAERLLAQLERSPNTFRDVRREVATAKAHFYLKQKMYDRAVEPLQTAIQLGDDKIMKARLSFILGQIHQQAGRGEAAYAAFEEVLKHQPVYEMEFAARLNLAIAGGSDEKSINQLERMLKEDKNKEYRDQIYYALAQIALKNKDRKKAIENLQLSLNASTRNISQKAEAYLQLADLFFEDENYVKAKLYFDSTLLVMTNADDRHERVSRLSANLSEIAENIKIIQLQDSLLNISRMTTEERRNLAAKIKKEQEEKRLADLKKQAEQAAKNAASSPAGSRPLPANPVPGAGQQNASKFWAYDDREVKKNVREFERKWGSRTLGDNWRRSAQQSSQAEAIEAAEEAIGGAITDEDVDKILKDVPDEPEEVNAANRMVETAWFSLGNLYRDRLQNNQKSVQSLEELLRRYPETQYKLDAMYYLYLAYKDLNDEPNARRYFDEIVNGYPNSHYAKLLTDPNYLKSLAENADKLTRFYDETYAAFERRQFHVVNDRINQVGEAFGGNNKLQPRFALLQAMAIGNLQGREAYIEALKQVIAKHADAPESTRAKEILRLLGENIGSGPGQQRDLPQSEGQVGPYKLTDDQLHYVVVIFKKDINLNDAKVAVTEYNEKYHNLQKLRMNNIYLDSGEPKIPLIAIRRFKDKKEAMDFYEGVGKNKSDFLDVGKFDYELFPISQDNYRELLRVKNVEEYRNFFQANYLK